jgi:hypothetical protein
MVKNIKKNQASDLKTHKNMGVVIDCDEITISVFPPPREHGKPHCHVRSKKSRKVKGKPSEVYPELKVYLDGSGIIVVTEGFSMRDVRIIGEIIFNDPAEGELSNDQYLESIWQELHHE